jgi:X-linked retinitis pigmentosa GTPase regulator
MRKIAAGSFSSCISLDHGDVYLWGSGIFGEFLTPHRIKKINGVAIDISIGNNYALALNELGKVYAWGMNTSGELGTGDYIERATP